MLPPVLPLASLLAPKPDLPLLAVTWFGGALLVLCLLLLIRGPRLDPAFRVAMGRCLLGIGAATLLLFQLMAAKEALEFPQRITALGSRAHIGDWGWALVRIARASLFGWLLLLLSLGGARLAGAVGRPLRPATGLLLLLLSVFLCLFLVVGRSDAVGAAFEARWGGLAASAPHAPDLGGAWPPPWIRPDPRPAGNLLGLLPLFHVLLLPAAAVAALGLLELLRVARGREPRWGAPWTGARLLLQAAALAVAVVLVELLAMERGTVLFRWPHAPSSSVLVDDFRAKAWPALAVAWLSLGCLVIGVRERWLRRGEPEPEPREGGGEPGAGLRVP